MPKLSFTRDREDRHFEAAVRRAISGLSSTASLHEIRDEVVKAFGLEIDDITRKSRWCIDSMARMAYMVVSRRLTDHSLNEIAVLCGSVDHTTLVHATRRYRDIMERILGAEKSLTEGQKKARRTKAEWMEDRRHEQLAKLVEWSVEDAWSSVEDIFPNLDHHSSNKRLEFLRQRGWAESEWHENHIWWRVTPLGREVYEKKQQELLAEAESQQRGGPVENSVCSVALSRSSTEFVSENAA